MLSNWLSRISLAGLLGAGALVASCDDGDLPSDTTTTTTSSGTTTGTAGNGGVGGATGGGGAGASGGTGGTGGAPDCVTNPQTHVEIINACTDADKIDKQSNLPLLNPDGTLPALP